MKIRDFAILIGIIGIVLMMVVPDTYSFVRLFTDY